MYLSLSRHYPAVPMFNAQNFAHCPMHLIKKAISQIAEDKLVERSHSASPVALAATALLTSKGAKDVKPEWFNPALKQLQKREILKNIDIESARTFIELRNQDRLVPWVLAHKDIVEQITLVTQNDL